MGNRDVECVKWVVVMQRARFRDGSACTGIEDNGSRHRC
jgi:hypothetical protein